MILYSIYIIYNYSLFVLQNDTDNIESGPKRHGTQDRITI